MPATRDLRTLPKAHLHLHFTGSMRPGTLLELAESHGVRLPNALTSAYPPRLSTTDARGWFRFQRLYDTARSVLRTPDDVRRVVFEAAQDDAAEGSGWLELQVDPSGYLGFGGLTPFVELMLDAARQAHASTGVGVGIVIAANRTRHPLDARTLARVAARYADAGVVGFGLSNDERRGAPPTSRPRSGSRATLDCSPFPMVASCSGRPVSSTASTCSAPTGWDTACARSRIRGCSTSSRHAASCARCARGRTSRSV